MSYSATEANAKKKKTPTYCLRAHSDGEGRTIVRIACTASDHGPPDHSPPRTRTLFSVRTPWYKGRPKTYRTVPWPPWLNTNTREAGYGIVGGS